MSSLRENGRDLPLFTPAIPTKCVRRFKTGAASPVNVASWNSTGQYAITGQGREIHLWNPFRVAASPGEQGALLIKTYTGHGYPVTGLSISKDGARLASCGGDKCAILWDTSTGAILRKLYGHDQSVTSVALNDEASVAFTTSNDKGIRGFDLRAGGSGRGALQMLGDARDNATHVLISRDGCEVIVGSHDGCVRTYDLRAATCTLDETGIPATTMALSRDGNCLLLSSLERSGLMALMERGSGALLAKYKDGHRNGLYRLQGSFTHDDAAVIAPSEDGSVSFYDLVTRDVIGSITGAHKRVVSCAIAHPSPLIPAMLTSSFDGSCALWVADGHENSLDGLSILGDPA